MTASTDEAQYVTLCLETEVFAVPVAFVREILDYRDASRIPNGPDYLLGLIDVRGSGVPVIDLRLKLGLSKVTPTVSTRMMVLDVPIKNRALALGLVADRVLEVITVTKENIEPPPDVGVAWRSDYIDGVVRRDNGFVVLLNLPKLLTSAEADTLSATVRTAA